MEEILNYILDEVEKRIINTYTDNITTKMNEIINTELNMNISIMYHLKLYDIHYILIGEDHQLKSSKFTFYDILKDLLNNSKIEIDIFIENVLQKKKKFE